MTHEGVIVAVEDYEIADPHLALGLTDLVDVTLAVNKSAPCIDLQCSVLEMSLSG